MKSLKHVFFLLLALVMICLAACSKPTYIVSFETGSETTIEAQEVKEGELALKPADPTKLGFEFAGWYNGETEYKFDEAVMANVTLTAKWNDVYFTVSFETGSDSVIEAQRVKYGEKATKPANPTKTDYKFQGWFNNGVEYTFDEEVTSNVTLTAQWEEIKKYTITFVAEGNVVATFVVQEGKSATAPAAPEVEGKTFASWDGTYTNVQADATVNALYVANIYSVQFVVNGENYGEAYEVEYGQACEAPANPEIPGYEFKGWDTEFTSVKGDLVINAELEAIEYTIKYYNGTTEIQNIEPNKYTVEDSIALNAYEVQDYIFFGWYANAELEGESVTRISEGTTGNLTFYAFNVQLELNGGAECWATEIPTDFDPAKGIDSISNLPETFELDFFNYLSSNNLLNDERLHETCKATTWEVFSGLNPIHNGDPVRIWNDSSKNSSKTADGYVALFLYETIELYADLTVKDVKGGFLGSEPYKTKYRGLLDLLMILYQYKVENSKYGNIATSTATTRQFVAFVLDGYFYGTQSCSKDDYFRQARNVIPGMSYGYKLENGQVVKYDYVGALLPTPVKDGFAFGGWYVDQELTKPLETNKATNLGKIYAKWVEIQ